MGVLKGGPLPYLPNTDIHSHVIQDLEQSDNSIAVIDASTGNEISYSQLKLAIEQVAGGLDELGVRKGSVVAVFSPNCIEYVIVFFAIQKLGAIITTLNPSYTANEVKYQLEDSGAEVVFTTLQLIPILKPATCSIPRIREIIVIGVKANGYNRDYMSFSELRSSRSPRKVTFDPDNDVAVIPYSSGTTGLPKGVMLTHKNIIAAIQLFQYADENNRRFSIRNDRLLLYQKENQPNPCLVYLPVYHIYGMLHMIVTIVMRRKLLLLPRFLPEEFCSTIQKYQVEILYVVPPTMVFLAKSPIPDKFDMSSLKHIHSGAAPLGPDIEQEIRTRYKVTLSQGWGMTENSAPGTLPEAGAPAGSVGTLYKGTEIKFVDPDTNLICGVGEQGELWYRGPSVMKGYLNKPESTAQTLTPDGWLKTGDIGYYDKNGYLFITDRLKELIKYKGFQVAPAELESLLLSHPDVADAAVIGVPDLEAGELPKAFIVVKPGHQTTVNNLVNFVEEKVAKHKWLRGGVEFLESIPKSGSGKILRKNLRTMKSKL